MWPLNISLFFSMTNAITVSFTNALPSPGSFNACLPQARAGPEEGNIRPASLQSGLHSGQWEVSALGKRPTKSRNGKILHFPYGKLVGLKIVGNVELRHAMEKYSILDNIFIFPDSKPSILFQIPHTVRLRRWHHLWLHVAQFGE